MHVQTKHLTWIISRSIEISFHESGVIIHSTMELFKLKQENNA